MNRSRVTLVLGVAALALSSVAFANIISSRRLTTQVIWRDVRGAPVNVVSIDPPRQIFQLLDQYGQIWSYHYGWGSVAPVSPGTAADPTTLYYESNDCTGISYIGPFPARSTVGTPGAPEVVRIIPNNAPFVNITAETVTQGDYCQSAGSTPMPAIRFDTLPLALAPGDVGIPPYHPESIQVER